MGDTQNSEHSHSSEVPEQFRPYSCTELTEEQIEYAAQHLNETEETRSKYLRRIKRFIDRELEAFSDFDDNLLLAFLRRKRFDFKQTRLFMTKSAEFVEQNREYFNSVDTEIISRVIESKAVGFLPYRDARGRALALLIAENWNPDDLTAENIIFGTIIALHTSIENPVNQVSGYVAIIDCNGMNFRQFREVMNWILFVTNCLKDCCPFYIKEIHVINTPYILLMGWNIVKPLIDERSVKTITFHDSLESLHEKIPPCILPANVGGDLELFSNDHWATDVPLIREKFFEKLHRILN